MDYKYYSRGKRDWTKNSVERKRIEQQRLKYNLLGMMVVAIIMIFALNMFNIGDRVTRFFSGN